MNTTQNLAEYSTGTSAARVHYQFDPTTMPEHLVAVHASYVRDQVSTHLGCSPDSIVIKPEARGLEAGTDHRLTAYSTRNKSSQEMTVIAYKVVIPHLKAAQRISEEADKLHLWQPGKNERDDESAISLIAWRFAEPTVSQRDWLERVVKGYALMAKADVKAASAHQLALSIRAHKRFVEKHHVADAERWKPTPPPRKPAKPRLQEYDYAIITIETPGFRPHSTRSTTISVERSLHTMCCVKLGGPAETNKLARQIAATWHPKRTGYRKRSTYVNAELKKLVEQHQQ
jgi:hypothetical protein